MEACTCTLVNPTGNTVRVVRTELVFQSSQFVLTHIQKFGTAAISVIDNQVTCPAEYMESNFALLHHPLPELNIVKDAVDTAILLPYLGIVIDALSSNVALQ
jgi:hypothetical protein